MRWPVRIAPGAGDALKLRTSVSRGNPEGSVSSSRCLLNSSSVVRASAWKPEYPLSVKYRGTAGVVRGLIVCPCEAGRAQFGATSWHIHSHWRSNSGPVGPSRQALRGSMTTSPPYRPSVRSTGSLPGSENTFVPGDGARNSRSLDCPGATFPLLTWAPVGPALWKSSSWGCERLLCSRMLDGASRFGDQRPLREVTGPVRAPGKELPRERRIRTQGRGLPYGGTGALRG